MKRKCKKCKKLKDVSLFIKSSKEGWIRYTCKRCYADICKEKNRKIKENNPIKYQEILKKGRDYHYKNREEKLKYFIKWRNKIRAEVISYYSNGKMKCACCGEKEITFLCIDHINGGGHQHILKLNRRGVGFYTWLRKENYPKGYQVLCFNCNMGKSFLGKCPHNK